MAAIEPGRHRAKLEGNKNSLAMHEFFLSQRKSPGWLNIWNSFAIILDSSWKLLLARDQCEPQDQRDRQSMLQPIDARWEDHDQTQSLP